jgi:hypothetical protein
MLGRAEHPREKVSFSDGLAGHDSVSAVWSPRAKGVTENIPAHVLRQIRKGIEKVFVS